MWSQIAAIIWAQWRTVRNHFPRVGFASLLGNALSLLWYAFILSISVGFALALPSIPVGELHTWLATTLLVLCIAWQLIPLFTLSTGWSLQLNKLQIYPIPNTALFGIEVILRVTSSPEFILMLLGLMVGLMRHPDLQLLAPLAILLLLPFNLLVSLAIRELVLHSFERNRFREIFSILLVSIAILPQALLRSGFGPRSRSVVAFISNAPLTPWNAAAHITLGRSPIYDLLALLCSIGIAYLLARWFFVRSLSFEETTQSGSLALASPTASSLASKRESRTSALTSRLLSDPVAALVEKEIQSLLRMPRFRVAFGLACVFSLLILLPMSLNAARAGSQFLIRNFLPFVTLYGLLTLSDALLLNIFGTDRAGAALYFVAPVPVRSVILAKNLVAALFLILQACIALLAATLLRRSATVLEVCTALAAVAVVGLFFISAGNLTSVHLARPSDPRQTMRKASGGKQQLWLLLCSVGMAVLLGAAYLARWALDADWALFAVFAIEFLVGLVFYKVALDSAVEYAERSRESLIDALSKGAGVVGFNS